LRIYDFEGKKNISGERIREARLKLRLSQSDLAAAFKAKCAAEGIPQAQIIKKAIEDFLSQ
jgi:predicted DNA binding CopG/RHH family protein